MKIKLKFRNILSLVAASRVGLASRLESGTFKLPGHINSFNFMFSFFTQFSDLFNWVPQLVIGSVSFVLFLAFIGWWFDDKDRKDNSSSGSTLDSASEEKKALDIAESDSKEETVEPTKESSKAEIEESKDMESIKEPLESKVEAAEKIKDPKNTEPTKEFLESKEEIVEYITPTSNSAEPDLPKNTGKQEIDPPMPDFSGSEPSLTSSSVSKDSHEPLTGFQLPQPSSVDHKRLVENSLFSIDQYAPNLSDKKAQSAFDLMFHIRDEIISKLKKLHKDKVPSSDESERANECLSFSYANDVVNGILQLLLKDFIVLKGPKETKSICDSFFKNMFLGTRYKQMNKVLFDEFVSKPLSLASDSAHCSSKQKNIIKQKLKSEDSMKHFINSELYLAREFYPVLYCYSDYFDNYGDLGAKAELYKALYTFFNNVRYKFGDSQDSNVLGISDCVNASIYFEARHKLALSLNSKFPNSSFDANTPRPSIDDFSTSNLSGLEGVTAISSRLDRVFTYLSYNFEMGVFDSQFSRNTDSGERVFDGQHCFLEERRWLVEFIKSNSSDFSSNISHLALSNGSFALPSPLPCFNFDIKNFFSFLDKQVPNFEDTKFDAAMNFLLALFDFLVSARKASQPSKDEFINTLNLPNPDSKFLRHAIEAVRGIIQIHARDQRLLKPNSLAHNSDFCENLNSRIFYNLLKGKKFHIYYDSLIKPASDKNDPAIHHLFSNTKKEVNDFAKVLLDASNHRGTERFFSEYPNLIYGKELLAVLRYFALYSSEPRNLGFKANLYKSLSDYAALVSKDEGAVNVLFESSNDDEFDSTQANFASLYFESRFSLISTFIDRYSFHFNPDPTRGIITPRRLLIYDDLSGLDVLVTLSTRLAHEHIYLAYTFESDRPHYERYLVGTGSEGAPVFDADFFSKEKRLLIKLLRSDDYYIPTDSRSFVLDSITSDSSLLSVDDSESSEIGTIRNYSPVEEPSFIISFCKFFNFIKDIFL